MCLEVGVVVDGVMEVVVLMVVMVALEQLI